MLLNGDEPKIDRSTRDAMADRVAQALRTMYIDEDVAPRLAAETRRRLGTDRYDGLTAAQFAERLTTDLQEQTGDGHLYVRVRAEDADVPVPDVAQMEATIQELGERMRRGPGQGSPPGPARVAPGALAMTSSETYRRMNHGFVEARVMDGNVGLVRIDRFAAPTAEARAAADAAMAFVANTDAIILDLRAAPGGFEGMATYLISYFFAEERKPLVSAYFRFSDVTVPSFTSSDIPASRRRADVPLFILTSREVTFSAAEMVAYTLQKFGRARVVGETTRGGGYAVQMVPIGRGLMLAVSVGRPVHPVTKGGWQLVGVVPDVAASREQALKVAHDAARAAVTSRTAHGQS
ncbi:MAG TPA: S41 family peptidase [Thermoanaerobaculia bacterium]|nr:S41 family peptidase [Thermoanaerobaculia bacterium]